MTQKYETLTASYIGAKTDDEKLNLNTQTVTLVRENASEFFKFHFNLLSKENSKEKRVYAIKAITRVLKGSGVPKKPEFKLNMDAIWQSLSEELRAILETKFDSLQDETDREVRIGLGVSLGEILYLNRKKPAILAKNLKKIEDAIKSSSTQVAEGGLHAVAAFFSHADTTLDLTHEKLNELFAHTFTTHEESTEVSSAVSRAYAEVIVKFDPKKHNPNLGRLFQSYLQALVRAFQKSSESDSEQLAELLIQISSQLNPEFTVAYCVAWFKAIEQVLTEDEKSLKPQYKRRLVSFLVNLVVDVVPDLFQIDFDNSQKETPFKASLQVLFNTVFKLMIEDDKAPSSDWLNSKDLADKFFEDGKEFEKTKFGTFTVSLLLSALGATDKHVKTFLYPFIDAGLAKNTWPDQFAAIMIFSLTFEYFLGIEDEKDPNKIFPKEMNEKVDKILKKLSTSTNENPMVLYAIFHMVGNAAEDLNPLFFRYRGEKIIGSCLKMAKSPIQRVAENAITAFSNIISDIEEIKEERPDRINNYINIYLEVANHQDSAWIVREVAVSVLSNLANTLGDKVDAYVERIVKGLFDLSQQFPGDDAKILRNCILECISAIAFCADQTKFDPFFLPFVKYLLSFGALPQRDPQRPFICRAWVRLFEKFKDDIVKNKDLLFSSVTGIAEDLLSELNVVFVESMNRNQFILDEKNTLFEEEIAVEVSDSKDKKKDQDGDDEDFEDVDEDEEDFYEFEVQEQEIFKEGMEAVELTEQLSESFPADFGKCAQKAFENLKPLVGLSKEPLQLEKFEDLDLLTSCLKTFPIVLQSLALTNKEIAYAEASQYVSNYMKIETPIELDNIDGELSKIDGMVQLFQNLEDPFMNESLSKDFTKFIFKKVFDLLKFVTQLEKDAKAPQKPRGKGQKSEEDFDDEIDPEEFEEKVTGFFDIASAFEDCFAHMVEQHHQKLSTADIDEVVAQIKQIYDEYQSNEEFTLLVIYFIDDLIGQVPYELQKAHWSNYLQMLQIYSNKTNWRQKQSSLFGIGILFENSPADLFSKEEIEDILKVLKSAIGQQVPANTQKNPTLVKKSQKEKMDDEAKESEENYLLARDNGIASFGQVIFRFHQLIDETHQQTHFSDFFQLLPVQNDKEESYNTFQFVLTFINQLSDLFNQHSDAYINLILQVLIEYSKEPEFYVYESTQPIELNTTQQVVDQIIQVLQSRFNFKDKTTLNQFCFNFQQEEVQAVSDLFDKK